jgi:hypothetical protein
MTLEDFEKAKVIQSKLDTIAANYETIERLIRRTYACFATSAEFTFLVFDDEKLVVDLKFLEMAQKYYEQQAEILNDEFEALGKDNNNGIHA